MRLFSDMTVRSIARAAGVLTLLLAPLLALGCTPEAEVPRRQISPDVTDRPMCGWDELMGDAPDVTLAPGARQALPAGVQVVTLSLHHDVTFAELERAIAPARSLVRVKLVFDDRWLLSLTLPPSIPPPKPKPSDAHESVVGHRKITRDRAAPRQRFADLRVDGDRAELFVENEAPGGEQLALGELAARLSAHQPPVGVFALTASDDTRWLQLSRAIIAAACFDRKPGDEPHEIILDSRRSSNEG